MGKQPNKVQVMKMACNEYFKYQRNSTSSKTEEIRHLSQK